MKVLGLITEYNPFHNGHLYHLQNSKKLTGCEATVCIMSGNFIQRGLPALVNKWARTEMALKNGVDLVIELPVYYAVSSAEFFAYGAVKILDSLGIIDSICFGSECDDIELLKSISKILYKQPEAFKEKLGYYLSHGISFPSARAKALKDYFIEDNASDIDQIELVANQPNNILGIEYLKALYQLNSNIVPYTIKRHSADYHSIEQHGDIASATAIREMYASDNYAAIRQVVPASVFDILEREIDSGRGPVFINDFETMILSEIRKAAPENLERIMDVSEGMENRIKKAAQISGSIQTLLENIKTKRYTLTRIQRILIQILLGLNHESFNLKSGPQYARILGFTAKGRDLLSRINNATVPLVTSPSDFLRTCSEVQSKMLNADIIASDIYALAYSDPVQRTGGQDFYHKLVLSTEF